MEKSNITEDKATELAIEINAEEVIESIDDDGEREVWKVRLILLRRKKRSISKFSILVSWSTNIFWSNESSFNSTGL